MIKTALSNSEKNLFAFINEAKPSGYGISILSPKSIKDDVYLLIDNYPDALAIARRLIK